MKGDDNMALVVKDSNNKLDVASTTARKDDLTDHVIIVSGGRLHLYGTHRNLQAAGLVPGGSTLPATTEEVSPAPSMAPDCYSIDLAFETDGDAAFLSLVMYNLDDLADGVLNETVIGM